MQKITINDLRHMEDDEGLIIQGCSGNLDEWATGINDILTKAGILINDSKFEHVFVFEQDGLTNLLFDFEGVKMNIGKLALWRIQTHGQLGGTWLSDYVPNKLGGFIHDHTQTNDKPDCPLIDADGNIFNLIGMASRTLREHGMTEQAKEMSKRITGGECHDYYAALNIIGEYVNITTQEEMEFGGM